MKKLLAALVLGVVLLIGCQDNSTILAPNTDASSLNKAENTNFEGLKYDAFGDSVVTDGSGRPNWPRL